WRLRGRERRTSGLEAGGLAVFAARLGRCGRKADLVGIGFRNDEPLEPLGMPTDDAESDRTAVVLNVQSEARKPDFPKNASMISDVLSKVRMSPDQACRSCQIPDSPGR